MLAGITNHGRRSCCHNSEHLTFSRHFRNFHKYISPPSSRHVCGVHHQSPASNPCLLAGRGGNADKEGKEALRHNGQLDGGQPVSRKKGKLTWGGKGCIPHMKEGRGDVRRRRSCPMRATHRAWFTNFKSRQTLFWTCLMVQENKLSEQINSSRLSPRLIYPPFLPSIIINCSD